MRRVMASSAARLVGYKAAACSAEDFAELSELAADPRIVAVGETGLDFHRDWSPRPLQEKLFARQLELACSLDKPVFLHQRDARRIDAVVIGDENAH